MDHTDIPKLQGGLTGQVTDLHRRVNQVADELRRRLVTDDLAALQALRGHSRQVDRRLTQIDAELASIGQDTADLRRAVAASTELLHQLLRRLDP